MKQDVPSVSSPCWTWPASNRPDGYANVTVANRRRMVHAMIYEMAVGPIPEGKVMDHLCRNKLCVRPDHLEPVTIAENVMRGVNPAAMRARQTLCTKGLHPLSGDNLQIEYDKKGRAHRRCKRCRYPKQWIMPREDDTPMSPRRHSYPSRNKQLAEAKPWVCVNCGGKEVRRIDEEQTKCESCGWVTDIYETLKAVDKK